MAMDPVGIFRLVLYKLCFEILIARSSGSQIFYKIGAPQIFAKFTGKHLCWESVFYKAGWLKDCNFIKKRQHRCFPAIFEKF